MKLIVDIHFQAELLRWARWNLDTLDFAGIHTIHPHLRSLGQAIDILEVGVEKPLSTCSNAIAILSLLDWPLSLI
jgi:hypothetical protein